MNRVLSLVITLLVFGIALSRADDILVALSPYRSAEQVAPAAAEPALPLAEAELAGTKMPQVGQSGKPSRP